MTNPGDQGPLAPRGPHDKSARAADRPPRGVMGSRYGGAAPQDGSTAAPARSSQPVVAQPAYSSNTSQTGMQPTAPTADPKTATAVERDIRRPEANKPRAVRRARLRMVRLDPWSVTKVSFLLAIAFGVMCAVAVFLIFSIMSASGLWDNVNSTIQSVAKQDPEEAFDINDFVGMNRVMGITLLIAAINVVLLTALATLGAFIYNMAASLLGGLEVTLAEDLS